MLNTFYMKNIEREKERRNDPSNYVEKNDHWLNRLIFNTYVYIDIVCIRRVFLNTDAIACCRCCCNNNNRERLKENKMTKYCCCCVSSIISSSLIAIIWVTYHCTDNGTKVEARTYFATKPNKIKISTAGFRTKIYVCIHAMMQSGFSILYIYNTNYIFFNLESLMVIFWFFFNNVAALTKKASKK